MAATVTSPLPELRQRLDAKTRQLLDLELTNPNGDFAAFASVATGCIRAKLTEAEFERVASSSALGDRFSSSKNFKTKGQFLKAIAKAWEFSDANYNHGYFEDSRSIRQQLDELLHRIRTGAWTGRSANTDRAVAGLRPRSGVKVA